MARGHTESAINVLAGIMNKETAPESARVAAANSLLDRGWGKAVQTIAGDEENPLQVVTKIELVALRAKKRDDNSSD